MTVKEVLIKYMSLGALELKMKKLEVDIIFYMDYLPIVTHAYEVQETQEMIESLSMQHKQVVRELTQRQAMLAK